MILNLVQKRGDGCIFSDHGRQGQVQGGQGQGRRAAAADQQAGGNPRLPCR